MIFFSSHLVVGGRAPAVARICNPVGRWPYLVAYVRLVGRSAGAALGWAGLGWAVRSKMSHLHSVSIWQYT